MSLTASIYRWFRGDGLSPSERRQRNAEARKAIRDGTGWPCIDLDEVRDDWVRQAIINEDNRQNGPRPQNAR